jgi:hypothetical protein
MYNPFVMTDNDYKKALDTARAEMAELIIKKAEIEKRMARLKQTIASLSAMSEEDEDEDIRLYIPSDIERAQRAAAAGIARMMAGRTIGLTDAVREVLKAADGWQYPTEVRDGLERMGIDTASYSNILASIHTILKRLAAKDEVEEFKDSEGKGVSYRWKMQPTASGRIVSRNVNTADIIKAKIIEEEKEMSLQAKKK